MALARTVPNMEFENTVIALLDGKEFWRTTVGGEEDHKSIDQKLDDGTARINGRLKDIHFNANRRPSTRSRSPSSAAAMRSRTIALPRPATPTTAAASTPLEGGQQRVPAVHAVYIKGPVKITGMSDSASRQKIFICKPANASEESACARKSSRTSPARAFRRPVTDEDVNPLMKFYDKSRKDGHSFDEGVRDSLSAILASRLFLYRARSRRRQRQPRTQRYRARLPAVLLHLEQPAR